MRLIFLGIIAALIVLLWQSMEDLKAQAADPPGLTYGADELTMTTLVQGWAGRISPSQVNFGMEVLLGRPSELRDGITRDYCRSGSNAQMLCIASDVGFVDDSRPKSVVKIIGHENQPQLWQQYFGGTGLPRGPVLSWHEGWPSYQGTPQIKSWVQGAIYENKICFAPLYPEAGGVNFGNLDSCMTRELRNGQPDLKFTAGSKYVYLSELSALLGR